MSDAPARFLPPAPVLVLDTNAVLDWLVFADPRIAATAAAIEAGHVRWFATTGMRAELAHVLARPRIACRAEDCEHVLTAFDRLTHVRAQPPRAEPRLYCTDADDQVFVDLAMAEQALWLVTRDKALLALRRHALPRGLAIVAPEAWSVEGARRLTMPNA